MATIFYVFLICIIFIFNCGFSNAEALRILMPNFFGTQPISKNVRTTIYFELSKAFRTHNIPEKGAWLLYGSRELLDKTHDAAIYEATWPSVRADLVLWGIVNDFSDGAAIQLYLTITPIIKDRRSRPEIWQIKAKDASDKEYIFRKSIPSLFYEFEPFKLEKSVLLNFANPNGVPLYKSKGSDEIIGYLGEVFLFLDYQDDAIFLDSDGLKGWVRLYNLAHQKSEAVSFAQSVVQFFRGDWSGCINNLSNMLSMPNVPQSLRIDSLIYKGVASEKIERSGHEEFELAYNINKLNSTSASYLLMSRISDLEKAKRSNNLKLIEGGIEKLKISINSTRVLFSENDEWFNNVVAYSNRQ